MQKKSSAAQMKAMMKKLGSSKVGMKKPLKKAVKK